MARPKRPPPEKQRRIHFINEWADRRFLQQSDIWEALDIDKSTVSRWFAGGLPSEAMLPRIAAMFGIDIDELFRAPGDDWLKKLLTRKERQELEVLRRHIDELLKKKVA